MSSIGHRWHRLERRLDADRYMRLMLVGFAGSLLGTRAYLWLSGYPQVGGDTLHIAHAVWGGLLLFVGAVVPLVVANRAALTWAALLTGVGVGLFIDEVGKFITVDNDYFFPAAAPIAYAVYLLSGWVYLRIRRRRDPGPRAQLYAALALVTDALDHDLTASGRARLETQLRAAAGQTERPDLARLADSLLDILSSDALPVTPDDPGVLRRGARRVSSLTARWLTEGRLRAGLVAALGVLGILTISDLVVVVTIAADLTDGSTGGLVDVANRYARVDIEGSRGLVLLLARVVLNFLVGAALVTAAALLTRRGTRRRALELAQTALLILLTVVNLLVFYLEQFLAAVAALVQLTVLYGVQHYQEHHTPEAAPIGGPTGSPDQEPTVDESDDDLAGSRGTPARLDQR